MYPVPKSHSEYQMTVSKLLSRQFDSQNNTDPSLGVCFESKYIRVLSMSRNKQFSLCLKVEPCLLDLEGSMLRWIYTSHVFMVHGIPFCTSCMPFLEAGVWTTKEFLNYVDEISLPLLKDDAITSLWDFVEQFPNYGISTKDLTRLLQEHLRLEKRYEEIMSDDDDDDDSQGVSIVS